MKLPARVLFFIWSNSPQLRSATPVALMNAHVPTSSQIETDIVRIGMSDAVLAEPFSRPSVGSPLDRPSDHVMSGRVVYPAIRAFTPSRAVHVRQDSVGQRNQTAGREVRTFRDEFWVIGSHFFIHLLPRFSSLKCY